MGSVVTFLDHHRRTVFPAVIELRRATTSGTRSRTISHTRSSDPATDTDAV